MRTVLHALGLIAWAVLLCGVLYALAGPQPERVVIEVHRNVCGPVYETHIPAEYEFGY